MGRKTKYALNTIIKSNTTRPNKRLENIGKDLQGIKEKEFKEIKETFKEALKVTFKESTAR